MTAWVCCVMAAFAFAAEAAIADLGFRGGPEPANIDGIGELLRQDPYGMDVVLYKKYGGSTHVDPNEEEKVAFKDLPNRFPSVLSRDFRREAGAYEDFDNLYAMYLLYNLGKYSVRVNEQTNLLEIEKEKIPMAYPEAAELATRSARSDSRNFRLKRPFRPLGSLFGDAADNTHLYHFDSAGDNK